MANINEHAQHISEQTAGKIGVTIGASGSMLDFFTEWVGWVDVIIKYGNAVLLLGGLYLMFHKIFNKRRDRREYDIKEE